MNSFSLKWRFVEHDDVLHILFERRLKAVSNAIVGGGFVRAQHFLNTYVDKSYHSDTPADDLRALLQRMDVPPERSVAMMTAVQLHTRALGSKTAGDIAMFALVTAGVGNAVDITGGQLPIFRPHAGTINTMVFVDANLTDGAMINAIMSATEAKAKLLADMKVKDHVTGRTATGTSTDCVVIACTERGPALHYAGSATTVGKGIGQLVYETMRTALENNGCSAREPVTPPPPVQP